MWTVGYYCVWHWALLLELVVLYDVNTTLHSQYNIHNTTPMWNTYITDLLAGVHAVEVVIHHICMALEILQRLKCWCKERQWSQWDWHGSNMDDVVWDNIIHIPLQCIEWQKHVRTVIWSLVVKNGKANICAAPQLNSLPPASEVFV